MADNDVTKSDIIEIMRGKSIGMLTTVGDDGGLYSHPMDTQEVTDDGDVYFVVGKDSEQGAWLQNTPQVNMAYSDAGSWLSVAGTVRFLEGEERSAKIEQLWDDSMSSYFDGRDDPNLGVMLLDSESAQFWGHKDGRAAALFDLVRTRVTGQESTDGTSTVEL
ncbi:pyridoxamine 5'-phosphate oxidase family protein [Corynebacterium qintianiae]|uniref:Pyridoxamine 5'-phosphate oxidase family protein n=1 Tax=Corynebacterium qintianiae TaxID=2709392 RepID=A0A7T0PGI5_9CORY|nr:pyridoxamine 5'-phosphate oxidase family protein [Corynebacterium qintianiae]QPK83882.1 pyridoxamine 5'-phosphate oxidase family protein [Corynebacterium qintianiae]